MCIALELKRMLHDRLTTVWTQRSEEMQRGPSSSAGHTTLAPEVHTFGSEGPGLFSDLSWGKGQLQGKQQQQAQQLKRNRYDLVAAGLALETSPVGRGRKRSMQARDEDEDEATRVADGPSSRSSRRGLKRHDHRRSPTTMLYSGLEYGAGKGAFGVSK